LGVILVSVLPRVVAVVACLALSACTTSVGGTPVAGTTLPEEPAELTASEVFDDLTTIDPCSLTSPSVFSSFGDADFATPESLDYCAISVKPSSGNEAVIAVGAFGELEAQPELQGKRVKEVDGGLWVGQQDDTPSFCSQQLVFPDGVTVQVQGSLYVGDVDACPMVEAGMDQLIKAVQDGDVDHRSPERDSLVLIDPCSLVDDDAVGAIPGLTGARQPNDYPGEHTCFWEVSTDVTVRLQFGTGLKPTATGEGANEDPVAGRPTATNPYPNVGSRAFCAVETAHIPFTEVSEVDEDVFELASVFVRMPAGQVAAGCTAARAVAELVWPKLPDA
jgi:hypothetical protein